MRNLLAIGLSILSFTWSEAQYISQVLEYVPAPGQFTNTVPWGSPVAASTLLGGVNGSMCLGAFGGYVIFRFEEPVENDPGNPYGVDFTLFGNPMEHWSEPGVVWVMKDENENGLPDDTWFELAGSDFYFSSTSPKYEVTYINPGDTVAREVPWSDELGEAGFIKINSVHTQPYYPLRDSFPAIRQEKYTLTGTFIEGAVDVDHPPVLRSARRAFGYADNQMRGLTSLNLPDNPYTPQVENSGGDAFDIHWAVDSTGSYVDLDRIHFVKVQNAMLADGKYLGELSTEITGGVDVAPDPSAEGRLDLLVIKDLPSEIALSDYQLELFAFHQGRLVPKAEVVWSTSHPSVTVDEQNVLRATESGPLTLTASLTDKPHVRTSASTNIVATATSADKSGAEAKDPYIFPNPASEFVQIRGIQKVTLGIYTAEGRTALYLEEYHGATLDISSLTSGIYMVRINNGVFMKQLRLLVI
jgi:hypothetical protein